MSADLVIIYLTIFQFQVDNDSKKDVLRRFSPYFQNGWMRSFRFLDRSKKLIYPRYFTHFVFLDATTGFSLAKEILTSFQGGRLPRLPLKNIVSGLTGLLKIGLYRYLFSKLYFSMDSKVYLQLDMEQLPKKSNCIRLTEELDHYKRNVVDINWSVSRRDVDNIKLLSERFLKKWRLSSTIKLKKIKIKGDSKAYDAYHPVGTCKIGDAGVSVVDSNLKIHGIDNLWLVSTSVLPSAGTANPTFTILCLADNLVKILFSNNK